MFVLTESDGDDEQILGVFTTVEKAKKYSSNRARRDVRWSEPNLVGRIWADSHSHTLYITAAKLDPKI